jgi:hypothetical protein
MADIFVSYGRKDRPFVERLVPVLKAQGYSVWWDSDLGNGAAFARVIETEIRDAKHALVVWSKVSVASEWVYAEAQLARRLGKLRQIVLDRAEPPLPFGSLQLFAAERGHTSISMETISKSIFGAPPVAAQTDSHAGEGSRLVLNKAAPEFALSSLGFLGVGGVVAATMAGLISKDTIAPLLYCAAAAAAGSGLSTTLRLSALPRLGR